MNDKESIFVPGRYRLVIPSLHVRCWFEAENKEECAAKVRAIFWCAGVSLIDVANMEDQPQLQRAVPKKGQKFIPGAHHVFTNWEIVGPWDILGFFMGSGI